MVSKHKNICGTCGKEGALPTACDMYFPKVGDLALCAHCGELHVIVSDTTWKIAAPDHIARTNERIRAFQNAIQVKSKNLN